MNNRVPYGFVADVVVAMDDLVTHCDREGQIGDHCAKLWVFTRGNRKRFASYFEKTFRCQSNHAVAQLASSIEALRNLDELIERTMRIKQPFGGSLVHRYSCADD